MTDTRIELADEHYTVESAAYLSGRSPAMIRRYIRNGVVQSIPDPTDGRRRLIPAGEMIRVIRQPRRGYRKSPTILTLSDGSVLTIVTAKKVARPTRLHA